MASRAPGEARVLLRLEPNWPFPFLLFSKSFPFLILFLFIPGLLMCIYMCTKHVYTLRGSPLEI